MAYTLTVRLGEKANKTGTFNNFVCSTDVMHDSVPHFRM